VTLPPGRAAIAAPPPGHVRPWWFVRSTGSAAGNALRRYREACPSP
jgi:hypothetical protein